MIKVDGMLSPLEKSHKIGTFANKWKLFKTLKKIFLEWPWIGLGSAPLTFGHWLLALSLFLAVTVWNGLSIIKIFIIILKLNTTCRFYALLSTCLRVCDVSAQTWNVRMHFLENYQSGNVMFWMINDKSRNPNRWSDVMKTFSNLSTLTVAVNLLIQRVICQQHTVSFIDDFSIQVFTCIQVLTFIQVFMVYRTLIVPATNYHRIIELFVRLDS